MRILACRHADGTAGSWLNVMLFAIEVSQLWKYVKRMQRDALPIRLLLAVMVAIDFTATTNACAMVYLVRAALYSLIYRHTDVTISTASPTGVCSLYANVLRAY
jgi:hypothetical protein